MPEAFTYRPRHCAYNRSVVQCSDPVVRSKPKKRIARLSASAIPRGLDRPFLPDAILARLRHHEEGDQEHDRGNRDGIDQGPEERVAGAVLYRLGVGRCGDDGRETAAPA